MKDWFDAEHHVERAHRFYEAGRWEEAESELRDAIALDPYQPEWHFNLGLTLQASGRFDDAIGCFKEASTLSPSDANASLMIGLNLLRLDQPKEAIEWLERAVTIDPSLIDAYIHRIEAYTRLGDHDQAEVIFYMAQQVDARNADLFACMADSLIARGRHDRAVWCLREAARLDPDLPGVQAKLADAFAATGRHERARQLYLLELRRDPGDIPTLLALSRVLREMNRHAEAEEKLRRILEIEPDHAKAHFAMAELALATAQPVTALRHFDVVHRLDSAYPGVRRRIAALLLERRPWRDIDRAREILVSERRALDSDPAVFDRSSTRELGELLLEAGQTADATVIFTSLTREEPGDALAHHFRSVALLEMGRLDEGMEAAREAIKLDPSLVPAMHNLAIAYVNMSQWRRAKYWVRRGLRAAPDDAPLRRLRVLIRWRRLIDVASLVARLTRAAGRR
ncbi:MAG: tetratricopeptide repeat protein [Phycisphaeraceae bacterium]|nr:tetratricopeptide repeat protein [Phycisphaerae bacterium]MBX3393130.1 tetratricopeptide repeat protein [Phycisphaeraceae bacterium]